MLLSNYTECFESWDGTEGGKGSADDNQWQFYNVTANHSIPPSAILEVALVNPYTTVNYNLGIRSTASSGQADSFRRVKLAESEDGNTYCLMHVQLDSSGYLQYFVQHYNRVHIEILGYWVGGTYVERFDEFDPSAPSGWENYALDQYGVGSGQTAEILMTNGHETALDYKLGVRASGSTANRFFQLKESENPTNPGVECATAFVPTSGATAGIDIWSSDLTYCSFYLLGYFTSPPGDYHEISSTFPTPGTQGTWIELDVGASGIPSGVVGQFGFGQEYSDDVYVGVREKNSTLDDRQLRLDRQEKFIISPSWGGVHSNIDDNGKVEYYCNDISDDPLYYIVGYWDNFVELTAPLTLYDSMNLFIYGLNPHNHYIERDPESFQVSAGSWTEYDLTSLSTPVPASTQLEPIIAEIAMYNFNSIISYNAGVRSTSSSHERRFDIHDAEGGGGDWLSVLVPVDEDGKISAYTTSANIYFYVLGFWRGGTYTDLYTTFQATAESGWINHNLGSDYKDKTVEIVISNENATLDQDGGVRSVGNSGNRYHEITKGETGNDHTTMHVNTSGDNGTIQIYASSSGDITFTLIGRWDTPPGVYHEDFIDVGSPSSSAEWELVNIGIPTSSVVEMVLEQRSNLFQRYLGIRQSGSNDSRNFNLRETDLLVSDQAADMIRVHSNIINGTSAELYHSFVGSDHAFRMVGYWDTFGSLPLPSSGDTPLITIGHGAYDTLDEVEYPSGVTLYMSGSFSSSIPCFLKVPEGASSTLFISAPHLVGTSGISGAYPGVDVEYGGPSLDLFLKAWEFDSNCHYIEAIHEWQTTSGSSWNVYDLNPYIAVASGNNPSIVAEIMISNSGTLSKFAGIRTLNSSIDRYVDILQRDVANWSGTHHAVTMHVQLSPDHKLECYAEDNNDIRFNLLGYWVGPQYIETSGWFNIGVTGWVPKQLSNYGVPGNVTAELLAGCYRAGGDYMGARSVGSTTERYFLTNRGARALGDGEGRGFWSTFVNTSGTSGTIEVKGQYPTSHDGDIWYDEFFVAGYWSNPPGTYTEQYIEADADVTVDNEWQLINSSAPSNSIAQYVIANDRQPAYDKQIIGMRESGSALERKFMISQIAGWSSFSAHTNVNSDVEGYAQYGQSDDEKFCLLGYWDNLNNWPFHSGEISLYISGIPGFISTSGAKGGQYPSGVSLWINSIGGYNNENDLYTFGHGYEATSGSLFIDGIWKINSNENPQYPSGLTLFIDGFGITPYSGQLNLFIHGRTSSVASGDLFIGGLDNQSQSGTLFLKVAEPQTASLNLIVYSPLDDGPGLIREQNAVFYLQTYDDSGDTYEYIQDIDWYVPGIYFYDREFIGSYYETETAGDGTLPFYNNLGKGFAANQFGDSFAGSIEFQQNVLGRVVDNETSPYDQLADYPFAGSNSITTAFWMSGSQVPASSQISPGGGVQTESGARVHIGWFNRAGNFRPSNGQLGAVIPCHMLGLETRGESGLIVRTSIRDVPYTQPSGGGLWWGGTTHYGTPSGSDWTWNDQVSGVYYSWEEEWPEIQLARNNITFFVLHADFIPSGNGIPNHMKVYLSADGQPWIYIGSGVTGPPASSLYSYDNPINRSAENAVGFHVVTNNWSGGYYGTQVGLAQIALWTDANKFTEDELYDLYHIVETYERPLNEYRPTLNPPTTYINRTVGPFVYDPTLPDIGYNSGENSSGLLVTIEVGIGAYGEDASAYLLEETPPSGFYIRNISPEYERYTYQSDRPNAKQSQLNDPQSGILQPYDDTSGNIYGSKIRWISHDNNPEHNQRRSIRPTKTFTYQLYPFYSNNMPHIDEFDFAGSGVFFGGSTSSGIFVIETTGDTSGTTSGLTGSIVTMGCNLYITGPEQTSGTANLYIRTVESFTSAYIGNAPRTPGIIDFIYAADGLAALETMAGIEYGPPFYIQGPLPYSGNCPLFIRGPEGGENDLFTWGHEPFNSSGSHPSGVPLRIGDGHIVHSGSCDLVIYGPLPSSGTTNLFTMAGAFTRRIPGAAGHGDSPSLYTFAFEESSGTCNLFTKGPEFICTSGDFDYPLNSGLFTHPSGGTSPSLYTKGPEFICSSGDFVYPGDPNDFTYPSGGLSPDLYILPKDNKNNWFTLFIGPPVNRQTWTLYLKTIDNDINDSANLFIHGWQPASGVSGVNQNFSHMPLYLEATNANYPYTAGGTDSWTLFLKVLTGGVPEGPNFDNSWTLFLKADSTTSGTCGLYTYGHGIGESPHGIEVSGSVGLVCSVDPDEWWRIGYIPFNSDTDPWTLFMKCEPGHFGITTFYISGAVPTLFAASGNLFVRGLFEQETGIAPLYLMGVSGLFNNGPSGLHLFLDAGNQVYNTTGNLYIHGY